MIWHKYRNRQTSSGGGLSSGAEVRWGVFRKAKKKIVLKWQIVSGRNPRTFVNFCAKHRGKKMKF